MKVNKLFIVAYNIRQGGGAVLLFEILDALKFLESTSINVLVSCEFDVPFPLPQNVKIKLIKPGLLSRFVAELYLKLRADPEDTFLFFGNLPPLFKLKGKVFVYMQNRLLVDELNNSILEIKLPQRIKLFFKKIWLQTRACNADVFLVQTPSIKKLLLSKMKADCFVIQLPFCRSIESLGLGGVEINSKSSQDVFEFIYVASGEAHKNHSKLLLAWEILAMDGVYPILHLTLSEENDSELLIKFNKLKLSKNIRIENHPNYSHDDILEMYKKSDALIYPSFLESLGLPLIEARQLGIPVIASELDYVRDVIDPQFTFNPQSELSIARAVKRFMGLKTEKIVMQTAIDTLEYVIGYESKN
jgi:glycosyltransferase involved in cell wall biosynthesis